MNARVDPAALVPPPSDNDARLVAICRAAIRAIDVDIDAEELVRATEEQYDAQRPHYPVTDWALATGQPSTRRLRQELREYGPQQIPPWRADMRTQIAAVAKWERACKAVEKRLGLDKIRRTYDRAVALSRKYVADVASIPAATIKGAAWKATVSARWITAGYAGSDVGEDLVLSILHDVRLLGTGGNDGEIKLTHRKAAA